MKQLKKKYPEISSILAKDIKTIIILESIILAMLILVMIALLWPLWFGKFPWQT